MATSEKKVIIVTGANSGIGLEAAKGLCELGHDVIISVRDDTKGEATIKAVKEAVPEATITYILMELTEPQSIRDFVAKFKATGKKLNILLNNAGLFKPYNSTERFTARSDPKYEMTMTANCMGPFLLTQLLLDDLKASGTVEVPSRIVNVSSMVTTKAKSAGPFNVEDIMMEKPGFYKTGMHSYRNSKLAMNLWANELAKRLEGSHVIINSLCPGFIPNTGLARDNTSFIARMGVKFLDTVVGRALVGTKPPTEGRDRLINMSLGEEPGKHSGKFYIDGKLANEAPEVLQKENQDKIWDVCVRYSTL